LLYFEKKIEMGQKSDKEFAERTALIRLWPHPKPSIPSLIYRSDGEPMLFHTPSMVARFLTHRFLLIKQMPLPRELQWEIVYAVYWGDVLNLIHDVWRGRLELRRLVK